MRQLFLITALSILHSTCKIIQRQGGGFYSKFALEMPQDTDGCSQISNNRVCNAHNPRYNCTCSRTSSFEAMEYPSCDEVIKMRNVKTFVVEIRGMIPINPDFVDDFDGFLADLIESFCAIDPKYLLILRKRCSEGIVTIQIAFIRATDDPPPDRLGIGDLQAVHPNIFLNNKEFMQQTDMPILNVSEVDHLISVIRSDGGGPSRTRQPFKTDLLATMLRISGFVLLGMIILAANTIPICIIWKVIHDRKTRDSPSRTHVSPPQYLQ